MKTKCIFLLSVTLLLNSCGNDKQVPKGVANALTPQPPPRIATALTPQPPPPRGRGSLSSFQHPEPSIQDPVPSIHDPGSSIQDPASSIHDPAPGPRYPDMKSLYKQFEKPIQFIRVDGSKDTTLILKEGTVVKIPRQTFVVKNETLPITGPVEVNIREYYKATDIVFAHLTTQCGEFLLESGGMINVEVTYKGKICSVAPGKSFEVGFPDKTTKDQMEFFEGTENEKGKIVWQRPAKSDRGVPQQIFTVVEQNPAFPGGDEARINFFMENLNYPTEARESGIQGTVFVTFVVEADGTLNDIRVLRGIGGGCDEEAIRVIKKMPRWTPGYQREVPVRVQFNLPINFILDSTIYSMRTDSPGSGLPGIQEEMNTTEKLKALNSYFVTSTRTGWINCDRFINSRQGTMDYAMDVPEASSVNLIMFFHKLKTIISPLIISSNKLIFRNVLRNEAVTLLGIKSTNNKLFIAIQNDTIKARPGRKLTFREVDDAGLKKALEILNAFNL